MSSHRTAAVLAGTFFIVAAVAAVFALALYQPVLNDPSYVVSRSGADTQVLLGALFEVLVAISVIGTAITLYPVVRKQNETTALGYVAGRTTEGVVIVVGIISLIAIVSLRSDYAGVGGAAAVSAIAIGKTLVAVHNWTFLFGPNLALGWNTSLLAFLMYRSRLVPRPIAILGLIGGPVIFASGTAELFGLYTQTSTFGAITAIPVAAWEMSLALWMIIRGFRPKAVAAIHARYASAA